VVKVDTAGLEDAAAVVVMSGQGLQAARSRLSPQLRPPDTISATAIAVAQAALLHLSLVARAARDVEGFATALRGAAERYRQCDADAGRRLCEAR